MVSHNIVKVVCKDPKAISHAILELAIVDSLHTALHSVELSASAVELIFEPLTLVAELPGATWWQLVYDSSLAMLHISMKVANILVAVGNVDSALAARPTRIDHVGITGWKSALPIGWQAQTNE